MGGVVLRVYGSSLNKFPPLQHNSRRSLNHGNERKCLRKTIHSFPFGCHGRVALNICCASVEPKRDTKATVPKKGTQPRKKSRKDTGAATKTDKGTKKRRVVKRVRKKVTESVKKDGLPKEETDQKNSGRKSKRRKNKEASADGGGLEVIDGDLVRFLSDFDIAENEEQCRELLTKGQKWWREVGSKQEGRRVVKLSGIRKEQVEQIFLFLMDKGVPVRELRRTVHKCPEIMMAGISEELGPLTRRLEGLKITGKSLGQILVRYPYLLLNGDWQTITSVVQVLMRFGVHESQVHKIVAAYPPILSLSLEDLKKNTYILADLIVLEEDLLPFISSRPSLLCNPERRLQVVQKVLSPLNLNGADVKSCVQKEPRLLFKSEKTMVKIIRFLLKHGLSRDQMKTLVMKYPKILLRRFDVIQRKSRFLVEVGGRSLEDILRFPFYFDFSVSKRIGPRFVFLKSHSPEKLESLPLEDIINCTDYYFAQSVARVLIEEFVVFQAQWEGMYGGNFDFAGRESVHKLL